MRISLSVLRISLCSTLRINVLDNVAWRVEVHGSRAAAATGRGTPERGTCGFSLTEAVDWLCARACRESPSMR
jgi:hypothetical protein